MICIVYEGVHLREGPLRPKARRRGASPLRQNFAAAAPLAECAGVAEKRWEVRHQRTLGEAWWSQLVPSANVKICVKKSRKVAINLTLGSRDCA